MTSRQAGPEVEMLPMRRAAVARWWGEAGQSSQASRLGHRGHSGLGVNTWSQRYPGFVLYNRFSPILMS